MRGYLSNTMHHHAGHREGDLRDGPYYNLARTRPHAKRGNILRTETQSLPGPPAGPPWISFDKCLSNE